MVKEDHFIMMPHPKTGIQGVQKMLSNFDAS